ncbi:hypothetical protein ACFLZ7_03825 [Nanoarchaeota archaeon]
MNDVFQAMEVEAKTRRARRELQNAKVKREEEKKNELRLSAYKIRLSEYNKRLDEQGRGSEEMTRPHGDIYLAKELAPEKDGLDKLKESLGKMFGYE